MRYVMILALAAAAGVFASGCSINKFAADRTADILIDGSQAFYEEPDLTWARDAMPGNLKMLEALLKSSPENGTLLSMLAQGYCSYAFAFLEDAGTKTELERAKGFYRRGYEYGLRALPEKVRASSTGDLESFEKAVGGLGKDETPALFWTAYCLGNWVNLGKADVAAVVELPRVELMMRQVLAKNETYYYGGAHLFYGVYYGSRPKMLGGNPVKAKEHFEKAIALTGGKFLMPKVFLAQFYAVPIQDEKLFADTLQSVIKAPGNLMPSERLANEVARKKASKLLASEKDLF